MTDFDVQAAGLEILISTLTELGDKLRRFSAEPLGEEPLPPVCTTLRAATGLLDELGRQAPGHGYTRLAGSLSRVLDGWADSPAQYDPQYQPALDLLAAWLEDLFQRLDSGQDVAELAANRRWRLIADTFSDAGTCLAVFTRLETALLDWQSVWSDQELDPASEARLHQRWQEVRRQADALFANQWMNRFPPDPKP